MEPNVTPERIMQISMGFMASKALTSAANYGLFDFLEQNPKSSAKRLAEHFGWSMKDRGVVDYLDFLTALGQLVRENNDELPSLNCLYSNSPESSAFLVSSKPTYMGGLLSMVNSRLYPFWGRLESALKDGAPCNELMDGQTDIFEALYADAEKTKAFVNAMSGLAVNDGFVIGNGCRDLFSRAKTVVDVGGAAGGFLASLIRIHPHLRGTVYDLKAVEPAFDEHMTKSGLLGTINFHAGDFFKDETLPQGDVLVAGHILHDWNTDVKLMLLNKFFASLPSGGYIVLYESLIDDERKQSVTGLAMSLNMRVETTGGYDYSFADAKKWLSQVGFINAHPVYTKSPTHAIVAQKP